MKRILALDVAFTNIGWAIVEPYVDKDVVVAVGAITNKSDPKKKKTTRASNVLSDRIAQVYLELRALKEEYNPAGVIAEMPVAGGKSFQAAQGMALGNAITTILVTEHNIAAEWTQADEGKVAMCRSKVASKFDMQEACLKKFPEVRKMVPKSSKSKTGYEAWFEHSADAVAAYLAAKHGTLVRYVASDNGQWSDCSLF